MSELQREVLRAGLPLRHCSVERNDLLSNCESFGEIEYCAPEGRAFQLAGEFMVGHEYSGPSEIILPSIDDMLKTFIGTRLSLRQRSNEIEICVKGRVEAGIAAGLSGANNPGSNTHSPYELNDSWREERFIYWHRLVAFGPYNHACAVQLIDHAQPKPEMYLPAKPGDIIWTPDGSPLPHLQDQFDFVIADTIPESMSPSSGL